MLKITKNELYELYVEQQLTDAEIANKYGYSEKSGKMSIYRLRKKYGIIKLHKWQRHEVNLSGRQQQIIMGGLLGDASISNGIKSGKKKSYNCESCLEFKQGPKQKNYLVWKYQELKPLAASPPKPVSNDQLRFRSFHHPKFSLLRKEWYPDGKKRVPASISSLDALGLAVWFMDDGQNCCEGLGLAFSTCAFDRQDHELLLTILDRNFSIKGELRVYGGYNMLYIDNDYRDKLLKLIAPYCPECMVYKLSRRRLDCVLSKRQTMLS